MACVPDKKGSPPELDNLSRPDRGQEPDRVPVIAENHLDEARNARRRIRRAMLAERENQAVVLQGHVMGLTRLRRWYDGQGHVVGLADHTGRSLHMPIQQALTKMGSLIHVDDFIKLRENVQRRLREACDMMDPALIKDVKRVVDPVEEAILGLIEKITNLEKNPDYLFQFKRGGSLRGDLTKILLLMGRGEEVCSEDVKKNKWVLENDAAAHFPMDSEVDAKMNGINRSQQFNTVWGEVIAEYMARFELQESMRAEILGMARRNRKPMKIAKRMPGLIVGHLDFLTHGIAAQSSDIFSDQTLELGKTDAESMCLALEAVNRCLLALIDIHRTKQVIPSLA